MNKDMNSYGIDPQVWAKVAGRSASRATPALVALAASICPELLNEGIHWKPYDSLTKTEDSRIAQQCGTSYLQVRNALAAWVMAQPYADRPLGDLARWDLRLGVWCACAVAEAALKRIPGSHPRPRGAIETARLWVMGLATIDQVRVAANLTDTEDEAGLPRIVNDVYNSALAASFATYSKDSEVAARAVDYAADVVAESSGSLDWERYRVTALRGLREVVAEAIINYPTSDVIRPSQGLANSTLAAGFAGVALGATAMHFAKRL